MYSTNPPMKRLSAITIALLTIATATPVQANELDYALAYEARINELVEMAREYNFNKSFAPEKRLQSRLYANRDQTLNIAGRIKVDMCTKPDKGIPYLRNLVEDTKARYAKLPDNATNKLDYLADIRMIITLTEIPCN